MKTKNYLDSMEFIGLHCSCMLITWPLYFNGMFKCIDNKTYTQSRYILCGLICISCFFGIISQMDRGRNLSNLFMNLALPYGIYTVMAFYKSKKTLIFVILSIALGLSLIHGFLVMFRKIKNKDMAWIIIGRRLNKTISVTRGFLTFGVTMIMLCLFFNVIWKSTMVGSTVKAEYAQEEEGFLTEEKLDTISMLDEEKWNKLNLQERLDVLQTVANYEGYKLGICNELNVGATNMIKEKHGYYSDRLHQININVDVILYNSSWNVLSTLCHEAYHSYQYNMVRALEQVDENNRNLKFLRDAAAYEKEFNEYMPGSVDFEAYYFQQCEVDARCYAKEESENIKAMVYEHNASESLEDR